MQKKHARRLRLWTSQDFVADPASIDGRLQIGTASPFIAHGILPHYKQKEKHVLLNEPRRKKKDVFRKSFWGINRNKLYQTGNQSARLTPV
jgi:hypothetical protein